MSNHSLKSNQTMAEPNMKGSSTDLTSPVCISLYVKNQVIKCLPLFGQHSTFILSLTLQVQDAEPKVFTECLMCASACSPKASIKLTAIYLSLTTSSNCEDVKKAGCYRKA